MAELINNIDQKADKITAADLKKECPEILQGLADRINAHLAKARKYHDKAQQHNTAAGKYLAEAQAVCDDGGFKAFQKRFFPKLGQSRVYELLSIATNKKSIEEVRASTRDRVAKHRANKAADSVTVTEDPRQDSITVTDEPDRAERLEGITNPGKVNTNSITPEYLREPEKPRRASTRRDEAVSNFTTYVTQLRQRIGKFKVERFAKTAVPADDLAELGQFFTDLAQLKKSRELTVAAGRDGNGSISPEESAEDMKAKHRAFEEAHDLAA
jgi:hypothetical protein